MYNFDDNLDEQKTEVRDNNERPILVTIIAVLNLASGFVNVFIALIMFMGGTILASGLDLDMSWFLGSGVFFLIIGLLPIISAFGLLKMKKWVLYYFGVVAILDAVVLIDSLWDFINSKEAFLSSMISLDFLITIFFFFYVFAIRRKFH